MDIEARRLAGAANQAVNYRNYRRARDRALVRLAQAYPDTYKQLLEMGRKADEVEGKKWIDLTGNTMPILGIRVRAKGDRDKTPTKANTDTNEGNNGGQE